MAIVKMKKLQLMVIRAQKEALLRDLQLLGCVSVIEPEETELPLKRDAGGVTEARAAYTKLTGALSLLDHYAPVKKKLLQARPEVSEKTFLDDQVLQDTLHAAEEMDLLEVEARRLTSEEAKLRSGIESLTPWETLDLPLDCAETVTSAVTLGTIPATVDLSEVQRTLAEEAPEAELFPVSEDKTAKYLVLVCLKEEQPDALKALRTFGFAISGVAGRSGTARENIAASQESIKGIIKSRARLEERIASYAPRREDIRLCIDRMNAEIQKAEAAERFVGTDSVVCMNGWLTAPDEDALKAVCDKYDCWWEVADPEPEEYPDVPVKLKNNALTNPLNMVTNMYSLPAYGSVDPNPLMAAFFIAFYGIMMADMGYGLIMIIAALVVKKFVKPKRGGKVFIDLLLEGGIATFIMGIVTGGFFGDLIPTLHKMFTGTEMGPNFLTKPLLDPLGQTEVVLYGAMAIGAVHLFTGMIINMVEKVRNGDAKSAIFEEGSWFVIFAGLALFIFKKGNVAGIPVVLALGVIMLVYGAAYPAKGVGGKAVAVLAAIYNGVTGWLGDILSYSRLMALMLAGSVVAQVFNNLATMPQGKGKVTVLSFVLFVVIFLLGHALNFALNLLGCFVHDLRLQCLEFFGKFYHDGGKPFQPLEINTKYVDVENHL